MSGEIPPTFYDKILPINININSLKSLVKARFEMLQLLEQSSNASIKDISMKQKAKAINWDIQEGIENDIASHFILGLIYCRFDSERNWFALQEARLFKQRILQGNFDLFKTLSTMGIPLQLFTPNSPKYNELLNKINFLHSTEQTNDKIYFVPFEHALSLIPTQRYFIYQGNVYIPKKDIINLFQTIFIEKIQKNLNKINVHYEQLMSDSRISNIVRQFERERELEAYKKEATNDVVATEHQLRNALDVDKFANKTFPLCMLMIQKHINENSHLMHFGRLQYTLFLKGAGLSVEEALKFFKKKYEKKTPGDKFEKQYAYNIRHSYGLEGKRSDYAPYSCTKILNMNMPSSQECHGCPFKTYNEEKLKSILFGCGLKDIDVLKILEKKRTNEFPLCCIRFFEAKFPGEEYEKVGVHPNHYFLSGMKAITKKKTKIEYDKK